MNAQLKTVLLTVLTLSVLVIAMIELSGVSSKAFFNKYRAEAEKAQQHPSAEATTAGEPEAGIKKTKMRFENDHFDFGKLREGDVVRHTYVFENIGEHPLVLSNVIPTCGCTVPQYSKTPVAPGQKGEIVVEFNSKNQKGQQHKQITVVSNAEQERTLIQFSALVQ